MEQSIFYCDKTKNEVLYRVDKKIRLYVQLQTNGIPSMTDMIESKSKSFISIPDHIQESDPAKKWNWFLKREQEYKKLIRQYSGYISALTKKQKIIFRLYCEKGISLERLRKGVSAGGQNYIFYDAKKQIEIIRLRIAVLDPDIAFSQTDYEKWRLEEMELPEEKKKAKLTLILYEENPEWYQHVNEIIPQSIIDLIIQKETIGDKPIYYRKRQAGILMLRFLSPEESLVKIGRDEFIKEIDKLLKFNRYKLEFLEADDRHHQIQEKKIDVNDPCHLLRPKGTVSGNMDTDRRI